MSKLESDLEAESKGFVRRIIFGKSLYPNCHDYGKLTLWLAKCAHDMKSDMNDTPKPSARRADPQLLEILVCPLSKMPLHYDAQRQELISEKAGLAFPIREGIPIMLVDEARKI